MKKLLKLWVAFILIISIIFVLIILSACKRSPESFETSNQSSDPLQTTSSIAATMSTTDSASLTNQTSEQSSQTTGVDEIKLLQPVESNSPNTTYEPLWDDQTRAPGTITETPYSFTIITESLNSPWAVTALPDDRLVITEKAGTIRIMIKDGFISQPIGGFPEVDSRNQGGLLDVSPAPDFLISRVLYFTLAESTSEGSLTAVGRGRLSDNETIIEDFEIIWRAIPYYNNSMHFGSRLAFDKAGNIFATTGERSDILTRPMAQKLDNGFGKVVHITTEGDPVPGSPFVSQAGALPEIYSYGHRNIQGLAIHPENGEVWISEMGPKGGDELNLIKSGYNYGWPIISYGIEYSGEPISGALTYKEDMEQPIYYWDPSLAPSGMTFYTSEIINEWQNNLFIGGLVSQHIVRLVIIDGRVAAEERLLESEGQRFRDVGVGNDGAIYAVTDSGRLYRIGIDS